MTLCRSHASQIITATIALLFMLSSACDRDRGRAFDPARDSLSVRVYTKGWGMASSALDPEWRPESTTVRVLAGQRFLVGRPFAPEYPMGFRVVRATSPESAWFVPDPPNRLARVEAQWRGLADASAETVLVTRDPHWWASNLPITDAGMFFGLRLVDLRLHSGSSPAMRDSLVGQVVDAVSRRPWHSPSWKLFHASTAFVRVAWDTLMTMADSNGCFRFHGLRTGWVRLNVVMPDHGFVSRLVHLPADTLVIPLLTGSPYRFQGPIVAPPAAAIPIPPGSHAPWALKPPHVTPAIVGRWSGRLSCLGNPDDADCEDETGVYWFADSSSSIEQRRPLIHWGREGSPAPSHSPLRQVYPDHLWASTDASEPGGRRWEFEARGDTLVGQLIDPSTRIVAREFRANRVAGSRAPATATAARH